MKLFHLTPKRTYEAHIKKEGLKPQPIDPEWWADNDTIVKCKKGIFCWPQCSDELLRDWIFYNKCKNGNCDDEFVLLEVQVSESILLGPPKGYDSLGLCHTFNITSTGSHGSREIPLHTEVPLRVITKGVKPEDIVPVKEISTFVVVECPKII